MVERLIVCAASILCLGAAAAQPLADPTRPPGAGSREPRAAASAPRTRLQSVLIAPERSIAIIDGRQVGIGDRVGEATLVSIAPTEVVLRRGAEHETLKLFPSGVEKRPRP